MSELTPLPLRVEELENQVKLQGEMIRSLTSALKQIESHLEAEADELKTLNAELANDEMIRQSEEAAEASTAEID